MKVVSLLLIALLLAVATPACLNAAETDGKCSACASTLLLINGSCFEKINGCLIQTQATVCSQCQSGYILTGGICVRTAVFYNLTDKSVPPISFVDQKLSAGEIRSRIAELYGNSFATSNDFLIAKYPSLKDAKI